MDQVKAALGWLKEHHFWVLSVMVIGAVVGVWYTGSTSLASQYKSNKGKIESEFSSLNGLINQPFKPNDDINKKQAAETAKLAEDVLQEWRALYDNQVKEVLIWPKELPKRFRDYVEKKQFGDEIDGRRRELYHTYIKESFEPLVAIVDAEPVEATSGGGYSAPRRRGGGGEYGGAPGEDDGEPLKTYLVDWLDQVEVRERLEIDRTPSGLQIWVLQEDLWVYETLLKAIAATNTASGATRRDRAAVQTILELKVGQSAAGYDASAGRLQTPEADEVAAVPGGGFGGGFGGEYGGGFGGGYGGEYGGGGGEFGGGGGFGGGYGGEYGGGFGGGGVDLSEVGDDPAAMLVAGRYLDESGQPLMSVTPGDYSFGREFKRLPVRLTLEMDTRYLTNLMWELANAPLQVEVEQVRFNPDGAGAGGRRRGGGGAGAVEAFERRPTVGTVILQGIVYIFNEPDETIAATDNQFE